MRYAAQMAKWALYVMRVADDQNIDPDLDLHDEHISHGRRLSASLQRALQEHPDLIPAMKALTTLPSDQLIVGPPTLIQGQRWELFVTATQTIQEPLHRLLFSLVAFPKDQINAVSIRNPIHRYLSLVAWNPLTKSFYHPNDFVMILAKLQWMMRLVVLREYRQRLVDDADIQLRYEIAVQILHTTLTHLMQAARKTSRRIFDTSHAHSIWDAAKSLKVHWHPFLQDESTTELHLEVLHEDCDL
jgi:hypothetical protein